MAKRHTNRMSNNRVFSLILNENFAVPYSSQNEKNYYSKGHYWPPDYSIILKDKISVIIYLQSLKKNYFSQKFLYFILLQEKAHFFSTFYALYLYTFTGYLCVCSYSTSCISLLSNMIISKNWCHAIVSSEPECITTDYKIKRFGFLQTIFILFLGVEILVCTI